MLTEFTEWLLGLVRAAFAAAWSFVVDLAVAIVELVVNAIVGLVSLIPVPEFMSSGLRALFGQLDPGILYLLAASGVPAALGIIGAGYMFRLARKFATLFQW